MSKLGYFDEQFLSPDAYFGDNQAAKILYHDHLANVPIVDAHTHADEKRLASNKPYENAWEVAGDGDHYVYCLLRQAGVDEELITGNADPRDKWRELCTAMETVGSNPINFWLHEGLRTSLKVDAVMKGISSATADELWDKVNDRLRDPDFSPRGLLKTQGVVFLGTTDDPTSTLEHHGILADADDFGVEVVPTFRPDAIVNKLTDRAGLGEYLQTLGDVSGIEVTDFDTLKQALEQRHDAFFDAECRASDHGPDQMPRKGYGDDAAAAEIFNGALQGIIDEEDLAVFTGWLLGFTAKLNSEKGLVMQLHAGGWRNLSERQFDAIGPDTGYDGSRHDLDLEGHRAFLDWADSEGLFTDGRLNVIMYPLNTKDQETMASMVRMFAPRVKLGSSWWFIDTDQGMRDQFAIADGIISLPLSHPGMVSDTRSPITTAPRYLMERQALARHTGEQLAAGRMLSAQAITQVERLAHLNARELFNVPE